jgi:hypothetical protein
MMRDLAQFIQFSIYTGINKATLGRNRRRIFNDAGKYLFRNILAGIQRVAQPF